MIEDFIESMELIHLCVLYFLLGLIVARWLIERERNSNEQRMRKLFSSKESHHE
jgi:hypothetical protein